jgi:hypothetical protein
MTNAQVRLLTYRVRHPNQSVVRAVRALSMAEQTASEARLSLRDVSALLTHLRHLTDLALKHRSGIAY